jgi:hypothetical protein
LTSDQILEKALARAGSSDALAALLAEIPTRIGTKITGTSVRSWRHRGSVPAAYLPTVQSIADGRGKPAHPVEPLTPGHRVKGVSTMVDADGKIRTQWIKTAKDKEAPEEIMRRLLVELPAQMPVRPFGSRKNAIARGGGPSHVSDRLAVYPLGDPHVGLLSWGKETGADFDLAICEDLMVSAMRDLVLRGPRTEKALIVNLGDFFHADNAAMHTTKGDHALDVDGRAPKILAVGLRIMVALIDAALEHHAAVHVDNRIGNHDAHTSLMLSIALGAYYRNEPRVTIPATVRHRDYHEFGANLIGTTHGDRAKGDALPSIMAAEAPEAWGRTRHRTWLCGHVHHSSVKEHRGCTVQTFRTLAASDSWHAGQGYVSGRDMHRIVYHRDHGEVSREIVNVAALLGGAA